MSRSPSWDYLATFLAVIRSGSLSGASRELQVTQPTVRRHIEELEAQLCTTLFSRSPNGLTPNPSAWAILPYAESMQGSADALARAASGEAGAVAGTVRLTCSEVIAAEVAPRIVAPLLAVHPGLNIEIAATDRTQDLLRRDADLAVRMTRPTQAALVARHVGDIALGLYASRSYLADRPSPMTLGDLEDSHLLIAGDRDDAIGAGLKALGSDISKLRFALRTDSSLVQLASLRAGLGIGVCQVGLAAREPELVAVCPGVSFKLPTWIVMHEDLRNQPRVRVVFDRLVRDFAVYVALSSRQSGAEHGGD